METETEEYNHLIAERYPPGDRWVLSDDSKKVVHESLTETLEAHFQKTGEPCHFRLEPLNGKLFAIETGVVEKKVVEPKKFNIYGDF